MHVRRCNVINRGRDEFHKAIDKFGCDLQEQCKHKRIKYWEWATHRFGTAVEIKQILVECVAVQLYGNDFLGRRVRDPECLLQALENALAVAVELFGVRC